MAGTDWSSLSRSRVLLLEDDGRADLLLLGPREGLHQAEGLGVPSHRPDDEESDDGQGRVEDLRVERVREDDTCHETLNHQVPYAQIEDHVRHGPDQCGERPEDGDRREDPEDLDAMLLPLLVRVRRPSLDGNERQDDLVLRQQKAPLSARRPVTHQDEHRDGADDANHPSDEAGNRDERPDHDERDERPPEERADVGVDGAFQILRIEEGLPSPPVGDLAEQTVALELHDKLLILTPTPSHDPVSYERDGNFQENHIMKYLYCQV